MGTLRNTILQAVHAFSQHQLRQKKGRKRRRRPVQCKLPLMYPANFSQYSHKVFLRQQREWQQWLRSRRHGRPRHPQAHKQQHAIPGPIKLPAHASQPLPTQQQQGQWPGPVQCPGKRAQPQHQEEETEEACEEPPIFKKPRRDQSRGAAHRQGHQGGGKENVAPTPAAAVASSSPQQVAKPQADGEPTSQSAADLARKRAVRNARLQRLLKEWEAQHAAAGLNQQQGHQLGGSNTPQLLCSNDQQQLQQQHEQLSPAGLEQRGGLSGFCGDKEQQLQRAGVDTELQQQQLQLAGEGNDLQQPQMEGVDTALQKQQQQQQQPLADGDTEPQLQEASVDLKLQHEQVCEGSSVRQAPQATEKQQQQAAASSPDGLSSPPKGLKPQHWARVSSLVQAVAAAMGATNKAELQTVLEKAKTWGEAIPVHRKGNLQYCSICREDLEDTLLVYMMLEEDSSLKAITCRACFMAAFAAWVEQQGGPRAVLSNVAHLSNSQKLQLAGWVDALWADHVDDGSSCEGAGGLSGSFRLPSSRHAALLLGCGFEEGKGWPLEYCSLRQGLAGLEMLLEVLERMPGDFAVPSYRELGQMRPALVKAMPMPCTGDSRRSSISSNSSSGSGSGSGSKRRSVEALALDAAGLEALLKMLPPLMVTELVKPSNAASSNSASSSHDKSPLTAAAAIQQILAGVGLQQQTQGARGCAAVPAYALPYFNFNPIDRANHMGLAAADAAINTQLSKKSSSVPPSSYRQLSTGIAKQETKKLLAAAADAEAGGKAGEAGAYRFLATVLKIRSSSAMGELAVHDVLTQVLVLLGGAGTFTRGHLDPAAALTYAYALQMPDKPFDRHAVLAEWLLVSPLVFTQLPLLRKLLWTLRLQLLRRAAERCAEEAAAVQQAYGGPNKPTRAQQAVAALAVQNTADALAAAQAALAEFQQRLEQQRVLWGVGLDGGAGTPAAAELASPAAAAAPPAAAAAAAAAADRLSAEEEGWLGELLTFSSLQPEEMREVQQELGEVYAVTLQQRAGQGVSVPVGWMHWVHNTAPCIKIAWEVLRAQEMPHAVLMHHRLRCKAHNLAADYLAVVQKAVQELQAWRQFM